MTGPGSSVPLLLAGLFLATGMFLAEGGSHRMSKSRVDCSMESLEACLRMLSELSQSDRMAFAATREDLDIVCRQLREGVSCVDKHMDHCFNKQQRKVVESVVAGSRQSIVDLCLDKQMQAVKRYDVECVRGQVFRHVSNVRASLRCSIKQVYGHEKLLRAIERCKKYLEHAPCYREVATNPAKCAPYYRQVVQAGKNTANESNEPVDVHAGLRQYCCAFTEFLRCKFRFVALECSSEASRFLQTNTERMSGALIHQHCALYTYDSTCDAESASTSSNAALLHLVLTLLILSLFFAV